MSSTTPESLSIGHGVRAKINPTQKLGISSSVEDSTKMVFATRRNVLGEPLLTFSWKSKGTLLMKKPKILLLDIESTGLHAEHGHMIALGAAWLGKEKTVYRIDDYPEYKKDRLDDSRLVKIAMEKLKEADMMVTWYGKKFDMGFIRARNLRWDFDEAVLTPPHVDLWYTARYEHSLRSNRLDNWQKFLELPTEKTRFGTRQWQRAQAGYKDGLDYVVDHCRKDLKVLEEAYRYIRRHVKGHPNLPLITSQTGRQLCPVCCSKKTVREGWRYTRVSRFYQWRCSDCGSYSHSLTGKKQLDLR
jgi:uncharacterized protein YprB with RNaseH-like and TPR domain